MKTQSLCGAFRNCLFGLLGLIACGTVFDLRAQTALTAGDIAFTGYNSFDAATTTYSNEFSFVILRVEGITAGTTINFTDNGWNVATSLASPAFTNDEGVITWTAGSDLPVFTQVHIQVNGTGTAIVSATSGTAVLTTPNFWLSPAGDQVLAYQGALDVDPLMIAGVHTNAENVDGTSTLVAWDAGYVTSNGSRSGIPPGLAGNITAVMLVTGAGPLFDPATDKKANWKYDCALAVYPTGVALRNAINDRSGWNGANAAPYDLTATCAFAVPPVITLQPVKTTACIGMDTVLKVNASYATTYKWQRRSNSTLAFTDMVDTLPFSGSNTSRLHINAGASDGGGYYRVVVSNTAGSVTSDSVLLSVKARGEWLFGTPQWSDPNNWSCGFLPDSTTDVMIAPIHATSPSPVVDIPDAVCRNLYIGILTSVTFATAASALKVHGSITIMQSSLMVRGTLNTLQGKLIYAGAPTQVVLSRTYNNLEIRGDKTLTIAGGIQLNGTLTLNNGKLFTGDNTVTINATGNIVQADPNSFIVLTPARSSSVLIQNNIGTGGRTGDVLFPVGSSATSYTPLKVNNSGPATYFSLGMRDSVCTGYLASSSTPNGPKITNNVVAKAWNLSSTNALNASVTLQWNAADELPGFDNQNCTVSRYSSGSWNASALAAAQGSGPYSLTRSGLTTAGAVLAVGSAGSPLPLHLVAFKGVYRAGGVDLDWETVDEKNSSHFELQHATDGIRFSTLVMVPARRALSNHYSYRHLQPVSENYYRLKMIDADGSYTYSEVVLVRNNDGADAGNYRVYPNPAKEWVTIRSNHAPVSGRLLLYDFTGRLVLEQAITGQETKLSLAGYPAGMYLLQLFNGHTITRYKLNKE